MKKKRSLGIVYFLLIMALPLVAVYFALSKSKKLAEGKSSRSNTAISDFKLYKRDSTLYKFEKSDKNVVMVLFNPGCEICQSAIREIHENFHLFADSRIIFIGPNIKDAYSLLQNQDHDFLAKENVNFLHDPYGSVHVKLKIKSSSAIITFDEAGRIHKIYEGYESIDNIDLRF